MASLAQPPAGRTRAIDSKIENIFLTGATGNVGQAVLPQLLDHGLAVTALVRQPSNIEHCRAVVGRIEEIHRVSGEIGACDAIVHLACSGSMDRSQVLLQDVAGTVGLIDAWRKGPFMYASSARVYGSPGGPLTERTMIGPRYWHERGKYTNEFQLRCAERQRGRTGATLFRPTFIFAVNGRTSERHLLGDLYARCRLGSRFIFQSEERLATCGLSFIGGSDFGRAIVAALANDLSGPYNIASAFCTWRDLIQTINRIAGTKAEFVIRPDTRPQAGEFRLPQTRTELDASSFAEATGFQPRETLEEMVEALVRMERSRQPA